MSIEIQAVPFSVMESLDPWRSIYPTMSCIGRLNKLRWQLK